jgi:hypothetical protein
MYGVDMSKDGAQEYYNSLFQLYAEWGVDYVKVDDLLYVTDHGTPAHTGNYHKEEIAAIRAAIDNCGRPMVFSQSPGNGAPVDDAEFLKANTNLWRISEDFWDEWPQLKHQFPLCEKCPRTSVRAIGRMPTCCSSAVCLAAVPTALNATVASRLPKPKPT